MKKVLMALKTQIISALMLVLSIFVRRDEKKWAFGSWIGNSYSDNSKYLFETTLRYLKDENYVFYWIGNEKIKDQLPKDKRVVFLKLNSFSSALRLLHCKYFFCSQFPGADICSYNVFWRGIVVYLHHGIPIKKIGTDVKNNTIHTGGIQGFLRRLTGANRKFDYTLACSELHAEANTSGYGFLGVKLSNNLCIGYPRNDYLIENKDNKNEQARVKKQFAELMGYDADKMVITYLPTFRRDIERTPSLFFADEKVKKQLQTILAQHNAVLIEKSHNRLVRRKIKTDSDLLSDENLIFVSSMVDTQELLLSSSLLITDYSGCMLDYLLIDKPIINYVPDYEEYRDNDAGLLYELDDFSCGDVANNADELIKALDSFFDGKDRYVDKRERNRHRFLTYETGKAGKVLCDICSGKSSFDQYCILK